VTLVFPGHGSAEAERFITNGCVWLKSKTVLL
jgi:hypothetical protein